MSKITEQTVLNIKTGSYEDLKRIAESLPDFTLLFSTDKVVPIPTPVDEGKFLKVVGGEYVFAEGGGGGGETEPMYIIQVEWNSSGEATVISENHYAELKAYYDTHNNTLPKVVVDLVGIGKTNLSAYFEAKNMFTMFFHVSMKDSGELANTIGVMISNTATSQDASAQMWISEGSDSPEYEPSHIGCVRLERDASTLEDMRDIYGPDTNWQYVGVESNFHVWVRTDEVPVEQFAVYLSDDDYLFEEAGKLAETGVDYTNTIYSNTTKEYPTGIDSVTQGDFNLDYSYDNTTGQITIFGTTIGSKTKDSIMINITQTSYPIICNVEGYTLQSSARPVKGVEYYNQLVPAFLNATLPEELLITQNEQQLPHSYNSDNGTFNIAGGAIGAYGNGPIIINARGIYTVSIDNKNYELAEQQKALQGVMYYNTINKTDTTEHPIASQIIAVAQGPNNLRYTYDETTGRIIITGADIGASSDDEIVIYIEDIPVPEEPEITEFEVNGLEDEYEYGSKIRPTSCAVTITNSSQIAHLWFGLNFNKTQEITVTGDQFEFIPDELPPVETDNARITLIGETTSGATITYEGDILTIKNYEYWISAEECPTSFEGCTKYNEATENTFTVHQGERLWILSATKPGATIETEFMGFWGPLDDPEYLVNTEVEFTQANGYQRRYYGYSRVDLALEESPDGLYRLSVLNKKVVK